VTYALVTPARNEARFIESTIQSVASQTVRPSLWVIVSDGSTDGTDDIVSRQALVHPWIRLLRAPERRDRNFAGKVHAFNAGYALIEPLRCDAVGSLDADVSFDPGYFEFLLARLEADPALGLVGTPFRDSAIETYDYRFTSIEHVSGACQLFRRACFEDIGGYVPVRGGGIDHIAVITARMKGWKTRTFTEKVCVHHRPIGSASSGLLRGRFKAGALDYALGGHPLWEVFRAAYQMTKKPRVTGGLMLAAGYAAAALRRDDRPVPPALVQFRRREQMRRLKAFLAARLATSERCERAPARFR
jgi:glycosyltransferase involved in cell wall biosynthesis